MIKRREFIKFLSSAALIELLFPVPFSFSQSVDEYRNSALKLLINLILPVKSVDIFKQTTILKDINDGIDENSKFAQIAEFGVKWLDFNSNLLYQKEKFTELQENQQLEILNYTFNSSQSAYPAESGKPWTDIRYGKTFLSTIRSVSINKFYTSEAGWKFVGYQGPPQFGGHPNYTNCSN